MTATKFEATYRSFLDASEQIAVGADHINGLMDATRKLARFAGVKTMGGARG